MCSCRPGLQSHEFIHEKGLVMFDVCIIDWYIGNAYDFASRLHKGFFLLIFYAAATPRRIPF